mgnify:CR=1 FL=1
MSLIQRLLQLQTVDQEWDAQARVYQTVKQRLMDRSELEQKRQAQRSCAEALAAARAKLQNAELELASLQQKAQGIDTSLYSGRILAPRELDNLRKEGDYAHRRIGQLEDGILEQMAEMDKLEAEAADADRDLRTFEARWSKESEALSAQYKTLHAQLQRLKEAREQTRATVPAADLALYDSLRAKKGGVALAPMKEGICQICRVTSSARKVETVAGGDEIVACEGCGRILYQG